MTEPKIIKDFPNCPNCGSSETVAQLGTASLKALGKIPQEAFVSLRQAIIPLEQPQLAGVMISCIVTYFDVCAGCGRERCTRSEIIKAPVQGQPPQGGFGGPNRAQRRAN